MKELRPDRAPSRRSVGRRAAVLAIVWILGLVGPSAHGTTVEEMKAEFDEFTQRITAELNAIDPAAAEAFTRANEARDADDWPEAEARYREVLAAQPGFFHAKRRLCSVVQSQNRRDEALTLCREAREAEDTVENRAALLSVILSADGTLQGRESDEALDIALGLVTDPDVSPYFLPMACQTMVRLGKPDALESCVRRLRADPIDEKVLHYFDWILAMWHDDLDAAEQALEKARAAGLSEEQYAELLGLTREARPTWQRWGPLGLGVGAVWLGGLLVLLVAGVILSRITLRAARRLPASEGGEAVGLTSTLRRAYRAVLWMSCAYYYVSIPLVLLTVVLAGGGFIYMFFALGRVPIKLVAIAAILVLVTVWATLKSLFVRGADEDPGHRLDLEQHPKMRALLDEVAGEIGTRPVDNVYLTPGTELAVTERGGVMRQLRGGTERCLILGIGVLEGMKLGPFKAIMAHEYGHFSNKDTAGGGFALAVRRSLVTMANNLAAGGAATWYNPAWLFLNGFYRVFLRTSQGASRLQEILADRWAAFAYGARHFERGLRHVIERSIRFNAHTNATLQEVVDGQKPLSNLYTYRPGQTLEDADVSREVERLVAAEPSPYDSHPSPKDRFAWVHALDRRDGKGNLADAELDAWNLLSDREAIERMMTGEVRHAVAVNHGVTIAEA